jgi:signal transduction histidine kinase
MGFDPPLRALPLDKLDVVRLRRLTELGPTLGAGLHLESVLERLLSVARELTGARYAAVGVLDRGRRELERFVTQGIDEATRRTIGDLPKGHGVLGVLIRDPVPLRLHEVSDHPVSYGFPPGHPPMHSFLGLPVSIGDEVWGNLYLTEKAGGDFDEADEQAAMVLATWAGIAIANARFHEETEAQRDELSYTVRALEATTVISRALGGQVELAPTLELVVKRGRALANARSMLILLVKGDELVVAAMAGEAATELLGASLPLHGSASGRAVLSGESQRIPDFAAQIDMTSRRGNLGLSAEQFVSPGVHHALFVPMSYRGRAVGVLNVIGRLTEDAPFTTVEEELIKSFAASAATAVATAQSIESDRLKLSLHAMEEERSRWARELHDETLQGLGGLRMLLASARRSEDRATLDSAIDRVVEQVGVEIQNLRSLITDLRPASLDEIGLGAALEGLFDQRRSQSDTEIRATLDLAWERGDATARLIPELETAVYRLIQEALTNVVKHARAHHATVSVVEQGDYVIVTAEDDGVGFDQEASHTGFGLTSMRERVSLAGGELEIASRDHGTTLTARFPIRRVDSSAELSTLRVVTDQETG